MIHTTEEQHKNLYTLIKELYQSADYLLFHGWHHIEFVHDKSVVFARDLGADERFVQICALVHDLNYVAEKQAWSNVQKGDALRQDILSSVGFSSLAIDHINQVIKEAATENRNEDISLPAKALSDADTLFKALPITPILFASRFLQQTGYDVKKLGQKIVSEQRPLLDQNIYFYSSLAQEKYLKWAETNIILWESVVACLDDPDIVKLIRQSGFENLLG